jgi:hypothetical protein
MAVAGFKSLGWIMCAVVVAPGLYLVSSQVAAERARVEAVERSIIAAQRDIRDLETEFQTRANFAQLERWNGDVLALASPRPEQYAAGEAALASLNPGSLGVSEGKLATLLVPAAYAAAVAVPPVDQPVVQASAQTVPVRAAKLDGPPTRKPIAKADAVAMLDRKLLDDTTMGDLLKGARAERVRLR